MKAEERHKIKEALKYNKFRGTQAARDYLKGLVERKGQNMDTLINDVLKKRGIKEEKPCSYCGSDHGCQCRRKLEREYDNDRFYRGRD